MGAKLGRAPVRGMQAVLEPMYRERLTLLKDVPVLDSDHPWTILWPFIDFNVTADARHLHKVPLSAHPDTGNVCVVAMQGRWADAAAAGDQFLPSRDCVHTAVPC